MRTRSGVSLLVSVASFCVYAAKDTKLRLKGIPQISRPAGYPGPMTVAVGEVTTAYVIPDMFVKAANGEKPDAIIDWAERQLVAIYSKRGG